eukprot:1265849-Pyramimonas_sp.AAC.1
MATTIALGDFTARLGEKLPGEDDIMGEYMMRTTANANRELLPETCRETGAILANVCFDHPQEHLVTYYAPAPG